MNMSARRRMLEGAVSFATKPLYIYRSGDASFENCTHRSETYEGLISGTYDACTINFGEEYFDISNSAHQNADNLIYYFYLDVTRYRKVVVKAITTSTADGNVTKLGIFDSDGLKESGFTEENSKTVGMALSPKEYEFDVTNLKGEKVLAICNTTRYSEPMYYEIRME